MSALFTPDEAVTFLTHRLSLQPEQADGAAALASAMGYLPLALAQAAAYIADLSLTCSTYLERFIDRRNKFSQLLPDPSGLPDDHELTVAATWLISLELADGLTPSGVARPMLALAAMLDPNGIPRSVLTAPAALNYLSTASGHQVDEDTATQALSCLHRLSLITYNPDTPDQSVRVHALVQRVTREALTADQFDTVTRTAADALLQAARDVAGVASHVLSERVGRLLETLAPQQRAILVLRTVEGLSAEETAAVLGITASTVRVAQHRALAKLRNTLGRGEWDTPGPTVSP